MTLKLSQVLAIEKSVKARTDEVITALHHTTQKDALMSGKSRQYTPATEDGMTYPPERVPVQNNVDAVFTRLQTLMIEQLDLSAQKEWANREAAASIVVDGVTLLADVPATLLLALVKKVTDLQTIIAKMAELPADQIWERDPQSGLWRSPPTRSHKTEKVVEPLVLLQPTERHPGQAEKIVRDRIVGFWDQTNYSGAIEPVRKQAILARVQKLLDAVKIALEQANTVEAPPRLVGDRLLAYVFQTAPAT